jgi:hypothetical protein
MNKEFIKTANLVLGYLDVRFISSNAKDEQLAEKERKIWAEQLENKIEPERITQDNIVTACDLWAEISSNGFPPTIDQFIGCLKKVSYIAMPALPINNNQTNYLQLWESCDDRQKFRFFVDHPFNRVPPFVRKLFSDYNAQHRGWTREESNKMIRFHAQPFNGAGQGALINYQREILNYFVNRKVA